MNKKIIIALVCVMLVVSIAVTAKTVLTPQEKVKKLVLTKEKLDTLKDYNGVNDLSVAISDIDCMDNECLVTFYQQDLINTRVSFNRQICTFDDVTNETSCITKTDQELEDEMYVWLKARLSDYADVQKERADKGSIIKYKDKTKVEESSELLKLEL